MPRVNVTVPSGTSEPEPAAEPVVTPTKSPRKKEGS